MLMFGVKEGLYVQVHPCYCTTERYLSLCCCTVTVLELTMVAALDGKRLHQETTASRSHFQGETDDRLLHYRETSNKPIRKGEIPQIRKGEEGVPVFS